MIKKEILENGEKAEISPSGFHDIAAGNISKADADEYWKGVFGNAERVPEYTMSESELFDKTRGCSADSFDFEIHPDEKMLSILEYFNKENWCGLDITEQKTLVEELADQIGKELELENIPEIYFYEGSADECGFYREQYNDIGINVNTFSDPKELVDTVAHEMRHAYQRMRADKLETKQDELYKYSFENYIAPEFDEEGYCINFFDYQDQLVEAETRTFARTFTDYMEVA
ncbi:MAG: hypothetical protein IJN54_07885 [Lachnospiraceae bacterium]|nr:hypothetical protein [Lachnospiraceae bacterium]